MANNQFFNLEQALGDGIQALVSGRNEDAAQIGEHILKQDRLCSDAWILLCSALVKLGSMDDRRAIQDALNVLPNDDPARFSLSVEYARVLARRGLCKQAVDIANSLTDDSRLSAAQHDALGNAYGIAGLFPQSLFHTSQAIELAPKSPQFRYAHGLTLRYLGEIDRAESSFDEVLRIQPDHCLACFSRADLRKWSPESNHIKEMEGLLVSREFGAAEERQLLFALFKELSDCKRYEEAWNYLERGNSSMQAEAAFPTEIKRSAADEAVRCFPRISKSAAPIRNESPTPIFIVGLPRSGTTLVERILSRHPDVEAMGETQAFPGALRKFLNLDLKREFDSDAVRQSANLNWAWIRDEYLEQVSYLSGSKKFCTDKLPHNYEFVGQILQAFPHTKIVCLQRAPLDSLFGAYKILFGQGAYRWSYSQDGLFHGYDIFQRYIAGWKSNFGDSIIEVGLEDLIASPADRIKVLLDRLGLDFFEGCLSPEASTSGVSTASSVQIRQPINASGIGAWRNYKNQLRPLADQLRNAGYLSSPTH